MEKGSDRLKCLLEPFLIFRDRGAIPMEMKCILVRELGGFEVTNAPIRRPLGDEVIIKVEVTGLCRTDLKLIRVGHRDLVLPRIPGEEVVGRVVEKGASVAAVQEGDRVYVYPGLWCGRCSPCLRGAENLCKEMRIMGFHRDGGFAHYVTVPAQSVIPVPKGLDPEEAVFAEPLSCCLNALELGGVEKDRTVGIWGAGPAGTLLARASRALGAHPVSIEPDPRRRALAGGVESSFGERFDICIVAVGSRQAYQEALNCLAPRGCMVVFSGLSPLEEQTTVSLNQLHYHEQKIVGAYGCCYRHGLQALDRIADGSVPVRDMISHRMSLYDLEKALSIVENRQGMKVLLYPWKE
jgi:L-iditol 2-dehydrogenase